MRLTESSIQQKCPELINNKTHSLPSRQCKTACFSDDQAKPVTLDWEDLINLPYLSDIELSDFHLFQSLQNSLNEKNSP